MTPIHRRVALAVLACLLASPEAAWAQDPFTPRDSTARPAAGVEAWLSEDSDGTSVQKLLGRALWDFEGRDKYAGIALQHVRFDPARGEARENSRVYLDLADHLGREWRWRARVGTDGETVLGSAELRRTDWSQSFFLEREIVETDQGLTRGIYYTFIGASTDIAIDEANMLALTAGVQEFSGENVRLHLRGRYIRSVKAEAGISAHLDARYYHSTRPGEFDYFSPEDFVRVLPLLQIRRGTNSGWTLLAAGGVGAQKSTGSEWAPARFAQARLESPPSDRNLHAFAELLYTNDSISGGTDYDYAMGRAGLTMAF